MVMDPIRQEQTRRTQAQLERARARCAALRAQIAAGPSANALWNVRQQLQREEMKVPALRLRLQRLQDAPETRVPPAVGDLREVTDDNDPGSVNLSLKGGKAKMSYWWTSTSDPADFAAMTTLIYGSALPGDPANPGILRVPPLGHPRFPTLYAEAISNFAGLGGKFLKEPSADYISAPNMPQYARYPEYKIDVDFANRLYEVVDDA